MSKEYKPPSHVFGIRCSCFQCLMDKLDKYKEHVREERKRKKEKIIL